MSTEKVIKLNYPVKVGDTTVDSITLTRPKVKHLKAMDGVDGDVSKAETLISAISGQPIAVITNLDGEDFTRISEELNGFFGGLLPTGGI